MDEPDERAPLLQFPGAYGTVSSDLACGDHHAQFCLLVGVRPRNLPRDEPYTPHPQSLYARAIKRRRSSQCTYIFTAALVNTLLLSQIVLGAALTGLGASNSSRVLITIFGALNTIIAGVVAFLKSSGQPLRARMFRDDLDRVVDEIEDAAIMWYGISTSAHGYDAIDTDDQVTVRSEVARLTRLYDKAVKTNTMNDPDMYSAAAGDKFNAGLKKQQGTTAIPNSNSAVPGNSPIPSAALAPPSAAVVDPDDCPASKAPKPTEHQSVGSKDTSASTPDAGTSDQGAAPNDGKQAAASNVSNPAPTPALAAISMAEIDPDASPASAARLPKKEDSEKSDKTLVENNKS